MCVRREGGTGGEHVRARTVLLLFLCFFFTSTWEVEAHDAVVWLQHTGVDSEVGLHRKRAHEQQTVQFGVSSKFGRWQQQGALAAATLPTARQACGGKVRALKFSPGGITGEPLYGCTFTDHSSADTPKAARARCWQSTSTLSTTSVPP